MMWPSKLLSPLLVLCLSISAVWAQSGRDTTELTIEACLSSDLTVESVEQKLAPLGWTPVQTNDLSKAQLGSWAAFQLVEGMRFGAKSEVRWQEAWERAQKNAEGLGRLVDTESKQRQRLFFGRRDGNDVLEVSVNNFEYHSDAVYCNFIASPQMATNSLMPVFENQLSDDMPAVVQLRPQIVSLENPRLSISINLLRMDFIAELLGEDFGFIASVSTTHSMARSPQ